MMFIPGTSLRHNWGISLSHHYTKSFMYSDRLDSTSFFRPLPLGFTDSLLIGDTTEPPYQYYRDRKRTRPYTLPNLANYWREQPDIYFSTLPEHDLNASVKYGCRFPLPLKISMAMQGSFTGIWYPEKVQWFAVDNDKLANGDSVSDIWFHALYEDYAITYNIADGKYYLNNNRTDVAYLTRNLTELHHHEKTRIDGFFMISASLENAFGVYGTLFLSSAFSKGLSTMKKNEPVITFDNGWEFTAGWKKDLYIRP
jgi:hypothetical protein